MRYLKNMLAPAVAAGLFGLGLAMPFPAQANASVRSAVNFEPATQTQYAGGSSAVLMTVRDKDHDRDDRDDRDDRGDRDRNHSNSWKYNHAHNNTHWNNSNSYRYNQAYNNMNWNNWNSRNHGDGDHDRDDRNNRHHHHHHHHHH